MKTYLTYAPLSLIILWLYLLYQWYKSQRDFQSESGVNPFSPLQSFKLLFDANKADIEKNALNKLKQRNSKYLKIWIVSILIFVAVTLIVGIATAKRA